MRLTTDYILRIAKRDKRIGLDGVEICPDNQVTVWLDSEWTWCANDGNVTCMTYNVEGSPAEYRDDVATFLEHIKYIEKAKVWG
jgi:hypothetical protein